MEKTLIVIVGPTGVGKTSSLLPLAEEMGVPVINADSRQIFREIPIGTAAPTTEQQRRVKHFFVGNKSITDYYSAAQYETDVMTLLGELFRESDTALMCGGSMMYIDAVCKGIDDIPAIDEKTRAEMLRRLKTEGLEALLEELKRLDPEHYERVDRSNPRRVVHALEICHIAGRPYSAFRTGTPKRRPFRIRKFGLRRPREEMYERINRRATEMVEKGLVEEAERVYPMRELNALNTVGYKELFSYFDGDIDLDEAVRQIQSHTRRYMRKQMTWFAHDNNITWLHPDNLDIKTLWS
ncbi:MAG: tRNA (adenosine(37)-N6)-dimethylallyltransferase MiaA [Prevotella sp.]|nr:tRNA (adenosine(37)-N6)-dimethylallyltransferase MiaA [Prevotella sp.]